MILCPKCGHENDPGAKFCSQCATALVASAPAARTERKILTVLFADLVATRYVREGEALLAASA